MFGARGCITCAVWGTKLPASSAPGGKKPNRQPHRRTRRAAPSTFYEGRAEMPALFSFVVEPFTARLTGPRARIASGQFHFSRNEPTLLHPFRASGAKARLDAHCGSR